MDKKENVTIEDKTTSEVNKSNVGSGKKVAIYGCGFLILAAVFVLVIIIMAGNFVPFQGPEGVGP